jgi:hypothetical protein
MPRCGFVKEDGRPCERIVKASQEYCYSHDPARASERKRNAARGGKAKASSAGEIGRVKANLQALADATLEGAVDKGVAAVISQIWNVYLSAVRTDLKVREVTELEERLEELERALGQRKDGNRWGA